MTYLRKKLKGSITLSVPVMVSLVIAGIGGIFGILASQSSRIDAQQTDLNQTKIQVATMASDIGWIKEALKNKGFTADININVVSSTTVKK